MEEPGGRPREDRSLWLLVGAAPPGEPARIDVVYGLDLNLAYARGEKYGATLRRRWEDLLAPGARDTT